jgi:hypothetical protein
VKLLSSFKGADRIACGERCDFEVDGVEGSREGVIWNLSVAGLYLVIQDDIPNVGTGLRISLRLPGDPRPLPARVEVVWRNPPSPFSGCGSNAPRFPPGCGAKFVDIAASDLTRIKSRVESVYASRADRGNEPRRPR